jgi:hypothetical protein
MAMRCLTPADVEGLFAQLGFSVSLENRSYRSALQLDDRLAAAQARVGARPPADVARHLSFAAALNRWLPTKRNRLLWVDHWEYGPYGADDALIVATRAGLEETRSLIEAPGHYFDAHAYEEEDQDAVSREQAHDVALLSGLMSLVMTTKSDAWLIADGCIDRIEFWEGNLFFHSADPSRLALANDLLDQFECSRALQ